MSRVRIALAIVPLLAIGSIMLAPDGTAKRENTPADPARPAIFIITDQEGYGTGECLECPGGCGKIIADSFCESKGFKLAESYRKADPDEVTGSITSERKPLPPREPSAYIISCK